MDMTEDDSPEKAATLTNLGVSLSTRYEATGELRDLEESISLFQLANALTPDGSPTKSVQLQNLAASLRSLFVRERKTTQERLATWLVRAVPFARSTLSESFCANTDLLVI